MAIVQLDHDRLVMISQRSTTNLQLVDLSTTRARWIRMPVDLERAQGLAVGVAGGEPYISGGSLEQALGQTGRDNRQSNQGCDPIAITKLVPNRKVWVWSMK